LEHRKKTGENVTQIIDNIVMRPDSGVYNLKYLREGSLVIDRAAATMRTRGFANDDDDDD